MKLSAFLGCFHSVRRNVLCGVGGDEGHPTVMSGRSLD